MRIKTQIVENNKSYELISGPWDDCDVFLLNSHIDTLKEGNIDYITKYTDKATWVYRNAKGYIYPRGAPPYISINGRPRISEYRKLLKELQSDRLQTA